MKHKLRSLLAIAGMGLGGFLLALVLWVWHFEHYTPAEALEDLRAAVASRHAPQPVLRFLELRYGNLDVPANRRQAFEDFFSVGHIEGLHLIVSRMRPGRREKSIGAMARWIGHYRRTMTAQEKTALRNYFQSGPGQAALQRATAGYLRQSVEYRAATSPVIAQLMTTLAAVQKP